MVILLFQGIVSLLHRLRQIGLPLFVGFECRAILVEQASIVCDGVDDGELETFFRQLAGLMLRMDIDQAVAQFLQFLEVDRTVVDERPRLSGRQDFTPNDSLFFIVQVVGLEERLKVVV